MGKIPIDYNKLRELGMKVLTESWFHPYIKIVQNLHLFCSYRKGNFYI
jgi:hypothetical protein